MEDSRELDELDELTCPLTEQKPPNPQDIVSNRSGQVLIRDTILKSDHFPGCQNISLTPLLDGAPNFRQVPGLPIYGVAIPTVKGLRTVLDVLGAGRGGRKVLWHNMREEPVIYINGQPYVVRDLKNPLANLEYTGIDPATVENMEVRLKEDILSEAQGMQNMILVAGEDDNFNIVDQWESVTEVDVQTPREVYAELQQDGYDVDYVRVPLTDEKAPKEKDFDKLIKRCWSMPPGAAVVFNCQMGRGRTTTGTIIASLLLIERLKRMDCEEHIPAWFSFPEGNASGALGPSAPDEELKSGMYDAVRSLLRVLDDGAAAKARLDKVIDYCSQMQNLREAISAYRSRMFKEQAEHKRDHLLNQQVEYLERYYVLVAFSAYVGSRNFCPRTKSHQTFERWAAERGELSSILERMLRRNPLAALNLKKTMDQEGDVSVPRLKSVTKVDALQLEEAEDEETCKNTKLIARRKGSVLGAHTILKVDHWDGMQSRKVKTRVEGAPNFRGLPKVGVYASALPNLAGIKNVLHAVGGGPSANDGAPEAIWHNMREEPVVFINGQPFVLRESARPFKNMQEYTGIDAERLESMEARLKEDILAEARANNSQILLSYEQVANKDNYDTKNSVLIHKIESIDAKTSVKTLQEVFQDLRAEGFRVQYWRVPVTDGETPEESDLDLFRQHLEAAHPESPLVFSCQMGLGRSTVGMITGCLLRMEARGLTSVHTLLGSVEAASPGEEQFDEELQEAQPAQDDVMEPMACREYSRSKDDDAMLSGEYVAVRKLVRSLVQGEQAKSVADKLISKCGVPINLRTEIMRNLQRHKAWEYHRYDELQARRSGFKRGAAYLTRYWIIIAYAAFSLRRIAAKGNSSIPEGSSPRSMAARRRPLDLKMTFKEWLAQQPELQDIRRSILVNPTGALALVVPQQMPSTQVLQAIVGRDAHVPLETQQKVLDHRRGSILHVNTILKSYHVPGKHMYLQVDRLPIYAIGSPNLQALMRVLSDLGCEPGGSRLAVFTDITEEITIFIKGKPYVRRELEMPSRAFHHAGISYRKLQEMEVAVAQDIMDEASRLQGHVLVHHEVGDRVPLSTPSAVSLRLGDSSLGMHRKSLSGDLTAWDAPPAKKSRGSRGNTPGMTDQEITRVFDKNPGAAVAGMWESEVSTHETDVKNGVATTKQVFIYLRKLGYRVEYKRIPLSRDRTPTASDVDHLQLQMKCGSKAGKDPDTAIHLIMSRSMNGSSTRYVASMLATYVAASSMGSHSAPELLPPLGSSPRPQRTNVPERGEHDSIMSLLRVLEFGQDAKMEVDDAIDRCLSIGDIREDIKNCWIAARNPDFTLEGASEARQLGLHYLQRYALIIMFRVYLQVVEDPSVPFSQWYNSRQELRNMLKTWKLI